LSASETDVRRAIAVLDQYRAQIDALQRQAEVVQLGLEENLRARETAARYQDAGPDAEVLVPIGGNVFLVAQVKDPERALVGIGSDVVVQEPIPAAVERLEARVRELRHAQEALAGQIGELEKRLEAQSEFVQGAYERLGRRPEARRD